MRGSSGKLLRVGSFGGMSGGLSERIDRFDEIPQTASTGKFDKPSNQRRPADSIRTRLSSIPAVLHVSGRCLPA